MKEFYFTLREKISKHIIDIFILLFSLFVALVSWKDSNFTFHTLILIALFLFSYFLSKTKFLTPLNYCFILFFFFNPLLDYALSNFTTLSKLFIYLIIILLYKKFIFFNTKIIVFSNCVFIIFILISQFIPPHFKSIKEESTLTKFVNDKIKKGESVDVILLDAYPSFEIVRDSLQLQSKLEIFLKNSNFKISKNQTYSTKTPISVAQLFLNSKIIPEDYSFDTKDRIYYFNEFIQKSHIKQSCFENQFNFQFLSPTNHTFEANAWKLYWNFSNSRYFGLLSKLIFSTVKWSFFRHHFNPKSPLSFDQQYLYLQIDQYNQKLENQFYLSDNKKHFHFYHFLTLHKYNPNNPEEAFKIDLGKADTLGINLVQHLMKKRNSNIIVLSDHGNRTLIKNIENQKKGILAIKEL